MSRACRPACVARVVLALALALLPWPVPGAHAQDAEPPAEGESAPAEGLPPAPSPAEPAAPPAEAEPPAAPPFTPPLPPGPSQVLAPGPFTAPFLGPGAPRFTLSTSFGLTEEYTDNFDLAPPGQPRRSNFRTQLNAGLTLGINTPKTQGTLSTSLGFAYDTADSQEDFNFFPTFTASVHHSVTPRLSVTLTDSFTRSDDQLLADPTGERRDRDTFSTNSFSLSVNWLLDRFATQVYYRNTVFLGGDDSFNQAVGGNVSAPFATFYTAQLGYEFSSTTGDDADTAAEILRGEGDVTAHRVYASLSRQLGLWAQGGISGSYTWRFEEFQDRTIGNLSVFGSYGTPAGLAVSGRVGVSWVNTSLASGRGSEESFGLPAFSLTGSYRFALAAVSLSLAQDLADSATTGQDFGLRASRSIVGTFTYALTPFINTTLSASYYRNEPVENALGFAENADTSLIIQAGASWRILRWLQASLAYRYIDHKGSTDTRIGTEDPTRLPNAGEPYRENRATLTVTATF